MKSRYNQFNPKRRLLKANTEQREQLRELAGQIAYGGNPEHKKNPGDFGLTPPSDPRRGKSLCDTVAIFNRAVALDLLQQGLRRGLASDREENGWPKNIWAVTPQGIPVEAQLENATLGSYHGYPMPISDPMAVEILERWEQAHG